MRYGLDLNCFENLKTKILSCVVLVVKELTYIWNEKLSRIRHSSHVFFAFLLFSNKRPTLSEALPILSAG